jgi:hypothetical protein
VSVFFVQNSEHRFKARGKAQRPAVPAGSTVTMMVSLPSIVQADPEMILSFAENLSQNLKVEHDSRSGENTLLIRG